MQDKQPYPLDVTLAPITSSRRQFLSLLSFLALSPLMQFYAKASAALGKQGFIANSHTRLWHLRLEDKTPEEAYGVVGKPGSLIKLLDAAALLENRLIHPDTPFECRGITNLKLTNGEPMHCSHAHGWVTLCDAIAVSCNAYFANAVAKLPPGLFLAQWQSAFARRPLANAPRPGNLTSYALGYASEATLSAGDIIDWMRDFASPTGAAPGILATGMSDNTRHLIRHAMRGAARWGTGKNTDPRDRFALALKTGTTRQNSQKYNAWLAGFYPFRNPSHIFCVRAENGTSESVAVPALAAYLSNLP